MNIWWECKTNIKAQVMNWWIIEIHRKLIEIWKRFNKKIDDIITPETPLSIWFSDDSISNIQGMTEYFSHKIPYLWEKYKWRIFILDINEKFLQLNLSYQITLIQKAMMKILK